MVLKFDGPGLASLVAALTDTKAVAFLAGCVERRKPAVQALRAIDRLTDAATFDATLDDLWSAAAGQLDIAVQTWGRLDGFHELESEEEAEGPEAYAEDAIVALWYATQFIRNHDNEYIVHCASRCVDSAGFMDDEDGSDADFGDAEIRIQLQDLADLAESEVMDQVLIAQLKERAVREASRSFPQFN